MKKMGPLKVYTNDPVHHEFFKRPIPNKRIGTVHFRRTKEGYKCIMYCSKNSRITKEDFVRCLQNLRKIKNLEDVLFLSFDLCDLSFHMSELLGLLNNFKSAKIVPSDKSTKTTTITRSKELGSFSISQTPNNISEKEISPLYIFDGIKYFGAIRLSNDWREIFDDNLEELKKIGKKLERQTQVFPPPELVFRVFTLPLKEIRVLLIGQDPYHNNNQAMGLSFSVPSRTPPPPSLVNIFKELESDGFKVKDKRAGDLTKWFDQGVFLLNTSLTVRKGEPNSHEELWRDFMKSVLQYLDTNCEDLVIIAMGTFAQRVTSRFSNRHRQIRIAHPSPFSCHNFFGSKPFSKTNRFLREKGKKEIDWNL